MTTKERKEHIRLGIKSLNRRATRREMVRLAVLDEKERFENSQLIFSGESRATHEVQ